MLEAVKQSKIFILGSSTLYFGMLIYICFPHFPQQIVFDFYQITLTNPTSLLIALPFTYILWMFIKNMKKLKNENDPYTKFGKYVIPIIALRSLITILIINFLLANIQQGTIDIILLLIFFLIIHYYLLFETQEQMFKRMKFSLEDQEKIK